MVQLKVDGSDNSGEVMAWQLWRLHLLALLSLWLLPGVSLGDEAGLGLGLGSSGGVQRVGSTIKIGKSERSSSTLTGRGSSSIKIGEAAKFLNTTRVLRPALTTSMTSTNIPLAYASPQPESASSEYGNASNVTKMLKVSISCK